MITIRYNHYENAYSLRVEGHAEFADKGKDIVCAAVSILAQSCIASIDKMRRAGYIRAPTVDRGTASIYIDFYGDEPESDVFLLATITGLKLLAENYPDNVKFIEGFSI